jgi:hypothetical protein
MREEDAPGNAPADSSNSPPEAQQNAGTAGGPQRQGQEQGHPQASDAATLRQMFEFLAMTQQQQQQQFAQLMSQQAMFQQQMLQHQTVAHRQQKKKGNSPVFNGESSDDLELWIFRTEQYYADSHEDMALETSDFVNLIFANLGPAAQTWYRDFKMSLGQRPATWTLFKQRIRERFRDSDFQFKLLAKLNQLRWTGSQQTYTTKFLHLLSQLDEVLPDSVKRWFFQQNLRTETSAFVSQNVPTTFKDVMDLAQRFEDARPSWSKKEPKEDKPKTRNGGHSNASSGFQPSSARERANTTSKSSGAFSYDRAAVTCTYCSREGHTENICRKKKREAGGAAASKNA